MPDIAASAFGRDFLITNLRGRQLVDTFIYVLEEAPHVKSARLKKSVKQNNKKLLENNSLISFIKRKVFVSNSEV